jgi:uncharacterized linocin/CFP29 family protein
MNYLLRELAPIPEAAWKEIDEEAERVLKLTLAARKAVDFTGPLGWSTSAIDIGRTEALSSQPLQGAEAQLRKVQPMMELRVPFEIDRGEIEAIRRGAKDADLEPVTAAARTIAIAEDRAIFRGFAPGKIRGIAEASKAAAMTLTTDYEQYPKVVAGALTTLRNAGVAGPYAIALGPRCYEGLTETTGSGGYRVYDHVARLLDGPVIWAPAVDGAVVLSLRGGDFELVVGQDFSIGYLDHTAKSVHLYLQESFTFRVHTEEAAVPLHYADDGRARRDREAKEFA